MPLELGANVAFIHRASESTNSRKPVFTLAHGFDFRKALYIVGGLIIAITSLLLAPLPGPGWGTFFVGLMILAGELLIVARFLDRAEVIIRGPARRARAVWASVPAEARLLIGIIVPVCGAAFGLWVLLSAVR